MPGCRALLAGVAAALLSLPVTAPTLGAQEADDAVTSHRVGPAGDYATVAEALNAASPGDTVVVAAGTYRERVRIDRAVVLLGEGGPVLDGGGAGHVVEATAPLVLRGFRLRGSGTGVDDEHAGVMVRGASARIEDNRLEDVYYGIYLKNAPRSVVRDNRIVGKELPLPRRGDGIRLWYSSGTMVAGNRVRRTRDVVVYFSDSLRIEDNRIAEGRYGLHYMYSDHNEFRRNVFVGNQVGAFVMYSADIALTDNVFAEGSGPSGMGLGLKDVDEVVAGGNLFVRNRSGIYLDNSPRSEGAVNLFRDNLLLFNGAGVRMLPSVAGDVFRRNSFVGNDRPVEVEGGMRPGQVEQNEWAGNHWGAYRGFDRDGDGIGDTPYRHARLTEDLMSRHEALRLFERSPVMPVLEIMRRVFPLLEPEPVVVDPAPRLEADALRRWEEAPPVRLSGPDPS